MVCVVKTGKAKNSFLQLPHTRRYFFDPMPGDDVVAIDIAGLPSIAGNRYLPGDLIALATLSVPGTI
jgi:hypothetical protein